MRNNKIGVIMKYGISVGTPVESVIAAGKAIMAVMKYKSSDDVKVQALRVLGSIIASPTSATITGCTVTTVPMKKFKKRRK